MDIFKGYIMADRDSQITFRSQTLEQQLIPTTTSLERQQPVQLESLPQKKPQKPRLTSLDILRGLTMMGMIIVDCRGPEAPWWIKHVNWDGLSPADFVFPSFVFIMGMAVPMAINDSKPVSWRSLARILGLFGIGFLLNLADARFDFGEVRVLGILQRISICYLLVVLIHWVTRYASPTLRYIGTLLSISLGLLYLSLMLTFSNSEIDCPPSQNLSKFCNFGAYIDRSLFGQHHMIYPNDPEGLFTNLTAFLNGYVGYYYCLIMLDIGKGESNGNQKIRKIIWLWVLWALMMGALVYPLTWLMPLNKKIWSISFVFLTAAVSGLSLSIITYLFDILPKKFPTSLYPKLVKIITHPFLWLGRNPLAIFILMQVINIMLESWIRVGDENKSGKEIFYQNVFKSWIGNGEVASCVYAGFFLVVWALVAGGMYRAKVFIKL